MNEQMIEDELQHKLAEAIDNVIWPLADWDGDRLNASSAAGKAARAAHSVMAAKIAELEAEVARLTPRWPQPCSEHEYIADGCPDCGIVEESKRPPAALAPYPERRSEHHE